MRNPGTALTSALRHALRRPAAAPAREPGLPVAPGAAAAAAVDVLPLRTSGRHRRSTGRAIRVVPTAAEPAPVPVPGDVPASLPAVGPDFLPVDPSCAEPPYADPSAAQPTYRGSPYDEPGASSAAAALSELSRFSADVGVPLVPAPATHSAVPAPVVPVPTVPAQPPAPAVESRAG